MTRFVDASQGERCSAVVALKDGTTADCGRKRTTDLFCTQHAKMRDHVNIEDFTAYIGNGENSIGRFPANLSELHAALKEFAAMPDKPNETQSHGTNATPLENSND